MAGIMWGASWPKRVILLWWGKYATGVLAAKKLPVAYQNVALRQMVGVGEVWQSVYRAAKRRIMLV